MRNWSIYAGRLLGVELRVHLTFLFLLLFVLLNDSSGGAGMARGLALVALIFASVTIHEMGHLVVAARQGMRVRAILLLPIGGMALLDPRENAPRENAPVEGVPRHNGPGENREAHPNLARTVRVSLAGPLANIALALLTALLAWKMGIVATLWSRPLIGVPSLFRSFFWINLFLFALNMLPAFPLDGGRVLRALLARKMEARLATRRAVTVGHFFAATFMCLGALVSTWLMMVGLFLFMAAQIEERAALFQSVVETVRMEDIMLTDFSILSPADTLEDALEKAVHSLQDDFPVVRGSDLVGVINRQTILDRLRREGNGYVQGAMSRAFEMASRTESLASAFRKLTARGLTLIPVVEQERLVGIVTLQNLMHSMGLLAETRKLRRQAEESQP